MIAIGVDLGTTPAGTKACKHTKGETEAALDSSDEVYGQHGTMVCRWDSWKGRISTLLRLREQACAECRGGLMEGIQPPSTIDHCSEAHLCTGVPLAEA